MFKHIPNILTIIRFILVPLIVVLIMQEKYLEAFVILTVSGLTDVLDGTIARKYNLITDFGKLIDPLADKVTQISVLVTLTLKDIIPVWMIIIVFLKEVFMIAGASFLYGRELIVSSKWWGKLATVLFYIAIVISSKWYGKLATVLFYVAIVVSLSIRYFNLSLNFDIYIYYIAIIATIFSLFMYVDAFYRQGYLKKK